MFINSSGFFWLTCSSFTCVHWLLLWACLVWLHQLAKTSPHVSWLLLWWVGMCKSLLAEVLFIFDLTIFISLYSSFYYFWQWHNLARRPKVLPTTYRPLTAIPAGLQLGRLLVYCDSVNLLDLDFSDFLKAFLRLNESAMDHHKFLSLSTKFHSSIRGLFFFHSFFFSSLSWNSLCSRTWKFLLAFLDFMCLVPVRILTPRSMSREWGGTRGSFIASKSSMSAVRDSVLGLMWWAALGQWGHPRADFRCSQQQHRLPSSEASTSIPFTLSVLLPRLFQHKCRELFGLGGYGSLGSGGLSPLSGDWTPDGMLRNCR